MTLAEYYGLPDGTNAVLRYSSFYDTVDSDFPCPPNMKYMFYEQEQRSILKQINVSNVTSMERMFGGCRSLRHIIGIEDWDVSNVTTLNNMFYFCNSLTSLDLSKWDTSNVTNMERMFETCTELKTLSSIIADKANFPSYSGPFGYSELKKLTDFGGFINLKSSLKDYGVIKLPNLSYESCINVLNGLYDFTGNGETPTSSQGVLKVHQNFLDKVGAEISIGTNKGWTITT